MNNVEQYLIQKDESIKKTIKLINEGGRKILFVVDIKNRIYGSLTDGNIRRWIIKTGGIIGKVEDICNKNPIFFEKKDYSIDKIKEILLSEKIEAIPVINKERKIIKILFWDDIFKEEKKDFTQIYLPVVIMAGGKGTRLDPFTRILPKPLIPINDKAIIEVIIDEYAKFGMEKFYITINHKAKIIKAYFEEQKSSYSLEFIEEDTPLGTAGAIGLMTSRPNVPFVVTNGDVITDIHYGELLDFHIRQDAIATMAVRVHEWQHPFGVVQTQGVDIVGFEEKPISRSHINAGIYVLDSDALDIMIDDAYCDMPTLFERLKSKDKRTVAYPMHEPWLDVGRPDDLVVAQIKVSKISP